MTLPACRAAAQATAAGDFGARGDAIADDTAALQAALNAVDHLRLDGSYRITDALRLRSGQTVELSPGTLLRQERPGRSALVAAGTRGTRILLGGGRIQGPGGWSRRWTGNQGWEGMRGIRLLGCRDAEVAGPGSVVNWANAGVDVTGGADIVIRDVTIEGTHGFGGRLTREDNFQNGVYITNDLRWGAAEAVTIAGCDLSGTAQGVLREAQPRAPAPVRGSQVVDCRFHDIPGQHGLYNQDGQLRVTNCRFVDVALSAVKNQAGDAGRVLHGLSASGIVATRIGGSLFEVAEVGGHGGGIDGIVLDGEGNGVGFLVTLNGRITNATIAARGAGVIANALYVQGRGLRQVHVTVEASDIGEDGVLVTAPDAELTITPTIRDANRDRRLGGSGVRVSSAGARLVLVDPRLTDSRGRMVYGLFNDTAGGEVRVRGAAVLTGAADTAVRATGRIPEFPGGAVLQGAHGRIMGGANVAGAAPR